MVSFAEMFGEKVPQPQSYSAPQQRMDGNAADSVSDWSDAVTLSDEAREAAIRAAGEQMCRCYADWDRYGCFVDHAGARYYERLMKRLILGRSPTMVARLERERGLV